MRHRTYSNVAALVGGQARQPARRLPKTDKTALAFLPFFCLLGAAQTRRTGAFPPRPFKPPVGVCLAAYSRSKKLAALRMRAAFLS